MDYLKRRGLVPSTSTPEMVTIAQYVKKEIVLAKIMVEAISHAYLLDMATDSILSAPYIAAERLAVEGGRYVKRHRK